MKSSKKTPQKVADLSRISVISEIFNTAQQAKTAQKEEVLSQNVAYRITLYTTRISTNERH